MNGLDQTMLAPLIRSCTIDRNVRATVEDSQSMTMQANGITNLQQGLTWGWRTLSDNQPFTEGRPNDDEKNMKYIIFLSDGNNFYQKDYGSSPLN